MYNSLKTFLLIIQSDIEKLKEGGQYLTSEIKTIESKFSNSFDNVDSKVK